MSPRRRWLSTLGATALQQLSTRPMAYNGLMIDATPTTCGATIAAALDELSRGAEQQQRPNSVWLRVPMAQSALIAQVAPLGFRYHHAEGETAHLVLWFAAGGGPSAIPEYATHQVGVGAVVVHPHPGDAHPQVLVVKEAAWPDRGWKLPGGLAELGEHFGATAEREVREETGVAARFERVLAMRHQHGVAFGRSDLYVVCLLRGLAAAGTEGSTLAIRRDEREIAECQWMDLQHYHDTLGNEFNKRVAKIALDLLAQRQPAAMAEEDMASSVYKGKQFKLYYPTVTTRDS